jgi:hypothetical protein
MKDILDRLEKRREEARLGGGTLPVGMANSPGSLPVRVTASMTRLALPSLRTVMVDCVLLVPTATSPKSIAPPGGCISVISGRRPLPLSETVASATS